MSEILASDPWAWFVEASLFGLAVCGIWASIGATVDRIREERERERALEAWREGFRYLHFGDD